jgi:putative addiction module killer protein
MYEIFESTDFKNWIGNLRDHNAKVVIATRLNRIRQGLFGDVRPVGDGVNEARIHVGPGYRIYFQIRGRNILLILLGGDKGSQPADIARSKSIAKEWEL